MKQLNILSKIENVIIVSEKFNFVFENKIISTFPNVEIITLLINNVRGVFVPRVVKNYLCNIFPK